MNFGDLMNRLEIIENAAEIPIYPACSLILKGHAKFFEERLNGTGVSAAELPYLLRIYRDNSRLTQRDLTEMFFVSEPVVARTLKNLENKGFIIRNRDPEKRTRKILSLTDEGIKISRQMLNIADEWENAILKNMTTEEIENFKKAIKKITVNSIEI